MRYAVSNTIEISEYLDYDVVIIGSGLAGLYTALNIDEAYSCCILTKERVEISNSWLAQGGIAAALSLDDTPQLHQEDTMIAGAGLCDPDAVSVLVDEGPNEIKRLVTMNVPFDINEFGHFLITREGGHRKRRIVHAGGDATGRETVKALSALVASGPTTLMGRAFFVDLLKDDDGAVCGVLMHHNGAYRIIRSRHVVIATGGIGQVYQTSTNPSVATGDGLAAALRAGAELKDIEFIQFHPTGLWSAGQSGQAFLISEAVRGEGGLLRNRAGVRFMQNAHELKELAPRDIVARAIVREMESSGEDHVFVDITEKSDDFLAGRFPTIYQKCLEQGITISQDWIPVCPVQHYLIGGIATDLHTRTSVPGLYACGEAASTGVHGANRLASNSMLECLVFGRRAALTINDALQAGPSPVPAEIVPALSEHTPLNPKYGALRARVQQLMQDCGGVIRNQSGLSRALQEVSTILSELESGFDDCRQYIELLNIATVSKAILAAALARKDSVGAHYRED